MRLLFVFLLVAVACKEKEAEVWPRPDDIRAAEKDTVATGEIPIVLPDDFAKKVIYDLGLVQDYLFSRKDLKYDEVVTLSRIAIKKKYKLDSLMYLQIKMQNMKKDYPFPHPEAYKEKTKTWYFRFVDTLINKQK